MILIYNTFWSLLEASAQFNPFEVQLKILMHNAFWSAFLLGPLFYRSVRDLLLRQILNGLNGGMNLGQNVIEGLTGVGFSEKIELSLEVV